MKFFKKLNLVLIFAGFATQAIHAEIIPAKNITLEYSFTISNIPQNSNKLKIWIPLPAEDFYQTVRATKGDISGATSFLRDPVYGNHIAYYEITSPTVGELSFKINYDITRFEQSPRFVRSLADKTDFGIYLKPSRLVAINPKIMDIAAEVAKGKTTTLKRARAIYDYVYENMNYDKSIPGYGLGDSLRACDVRAGNCTDFHSLFIALCRAQMIPARFKMGAMAPGGGNGKTVGYHCWAEFYDETEGWVPVDISEAKKDNAKFEYYFGHLTDNRVEFSIGRDVVLNEAENREPLNYFIYPYIEIDGRPYQDYQCSFVFHEVSEAEGKIGEGSHVSGNPFRIGKKGPLQGNPFRIHN